MATKSGLTMPADQEKPQMAALAADRLEAAEGSSMAAADLAAPRKIGMAALAADSKPLQLQPGASGCHPAEGGMNGMQASYVTEDAQAGAAALVLATEPVLGIDIETTGLDPYQSEIRLLSAAALDGRVYVFDLRHVRWESLFPLSRTKWATFNGSFEWRHLKRAGMVVADLHDVMLLDRLLSHRVRKLNDVAADVLDQSLDKSLQVSDWGADHLSQGQVEYAAADALATVRTARTLLPAVDNAGQRRLYDLWMQALPVLAGLTLRGQSFDWGTHSRLIEKWTVERDVLEQQLREQLGSINYNSGPQIGDWLLQHLSKQTAASWPRTATGRLKTDAATLALHGDLNAVRPLLAFRQVAKLLSTYGSGWQEQRHPVTDRLHAEFSLGMTRSGRVVASRPNTQNPPRLEDFRQLFIPPPGQVMVGGDFSQIELRVAALLSNDRNMLDAYVSGADLHRRTAAAIAGCQDHAVTKAQRQAAKAVNFGNLYGQGPGSLARTAQLQYGSPMTPAQAREALLKFKLSYPQLEHWKQQQVGLARQQRRVKTRLGLVRDFEAQSEGYLRGEAQNIPVQGSAAEVLLASLARLQAVLVETDAALYHTVHDEIVLTCSPDCAEDVSVLLRDVMVHGFLDVFPEGEAVTHDLVEVRTGTSWAAVH